MIDRKKIIQIFKASPTPTSIVQADTPRFTFVQVNDAYTKMTQTQEEQLLGKSLFEAFPENPDEEKPTGVEKLRKSFEKVLESKQVDELPATRYDIVLDDGAFKEVYWEICNTPVFDEKGEVEFILNTAINITDRTLSERENKLMLNHTEDSFIFVDQNLIIQNHNELFAQNYKEIFGIEVRKGDSVLDYVQPERRETIKGIYERVFEGETVEEELPYETRKGNTRHFSIKYKPAQDEKNNITGSFISLIDRTEENNAKFELEKSEARFRALVENGSDVIFILSVDGKPTYISPSVENVLGYTQQEANEMEMISVVHPDDVEIIFSELQKCMDKPGIPMKVTPARMRHKDGSYRWFEGTITNMLHDPAIQGIVDNFRDITDRKIAEEKIEKAKTQYQSLIQTVDGIVWEADAKTFVFNYVSPQSKEILGYEPEQWIGKNDFWKKKIHPEDRDEAVNYCHFQTEKGINHSFEYRIQKADGEYIWIRDVVTVVKEEGKPSSLRGLMMDINNKKLTETQLNQKREQLQRIMDQSVDMICTAREGKFLSVSAASKYILGYEPDEMIGRPFTDFLIENDAASTLSIADYIQSDNNITDFENRYYNKDGCIVHLTWSARWDEKGKKMYAIARDTTELKVAQSAKEKERRDKEALINNTYDLIWSIDKNFNLITSNTNFLNSIQSQFGDKVSIGKHVLNGLGSDSNKYKKWEEYYKRAISGESFRIENADINPDNSETWFDISFNPIKEKDQVEGAACFARNITEFKKAQNERLEAENKYRNVVEHSTNMFYQHDTRGVLTYLSRQSVEFLGYPPEEAMRNWTDFITDHPINKKGEKHTLKAIETGEIQPAYELQLKTGHGKIIWVEVNEAPLIDKGDVVGIVGSLSNISDRKLYEEQLRKSLERYDIVAKATSDTIWDLDLETDQMVYNENIHNMFGYKINQVKNLRTWWYNKIYCEDLNKVDEALAEVLESGEERFQMEYRFKAADGSYKYILDRAFVIKDDDGKALRIIGAMQDVTQKEEEEERLKLLESVITNTSESVIILNDKTGDYGREIIYVNKAFTNLTGYNEDEVQGETLHFLNGPETNPVTREQLRQAMLDHKAIEVEFINYKKNGEKFWINTSMVPVQNNKNEYTHWVSIGRDITDKKEKEQEIKASLQEKETLLAEIHHRVKNNLAVVSGMMLLQAFDTENEALQSKLYDSVSRIKTMATVHELLYQSNSFSQLEFSETLRKLVENVSETFQAKAKVKLDISCDLVKLNINQAIPASLIVNEVITNAYKHAFKNRNSGKIEFNLIEDNEKIDITIKDNGVGFTEDAMQKKSLGLHLIQVLNDQINGTYKYKKDNEGTIFTLSFKKQDSKKGIGNAGMN